MSPRILPPAYLPSSTAEDVPSGFDDPTPRLGTQVGLGVRPSTKVPTFPAPKGSSGLSWISTVFLTFRDSPVSFLRPVSPVHLKPGANTLLSPIPTRLPPRDGYPQVSSVQVTVTVRRPLGRPMGRTSHWEELRGVLRQCRSETGRNPRTGDLDHPFRHNGRPWAR